MNLLTYLMESRGIVNSAQRLPTIALRFGVTASPMERALDSYVDIARRAGTVPTLAVTANLVQRYQHVFQRLSGNGAELAVHGWVHTDYSRLGYDEQRDHLERSLAAFRSSDIEVEGFRSPYIRWNAETVHTARDLGLSYSSNRAVAWEVLPEGLPPRVLDAYRSGLRLYRAADSKRALALPSDVEGLLDLPASLPDDEAMIDRLRLGPAQREAVWSKTLQRTHELGELFVLILHHERMRLCGPALEAVLEEARRREPPVWIAPLSQIATWWRRRRGFRLHLERAEDTRVCLRAHRDADAALVARGLPEEASGPWYGPWRLVKGHELTFASDRLPRIGVGRDASPALVRFLEEEGYAVARDAPDCALRLEGWQSFEEADKRPVLQQIEDSDAPLVRIWRWPRGARSALALTGDVDSMTLIDFFRRPFEV